MLPAALGTRDPCSGLHTQQAHSMFTGSRCAIPLPRSGLLHFLQESKLLGSRELIQNPKAFEVEFPHGWEEAQPGLIWPKGIKTKDWGESLARGPDVHFKPVSISTQKLDGCL